VESEVPAATPWNPDWKEGVRWVREGRVRRLLLCSNAEIFRFIEQSDSNPYSQITDRRLSKTRETQP
jgi:hypothetical protein